MAGRTDTSRLKLQLRRSVPGLVAYAVVIAAALVAGGVLLSKINFERPWQSHYTFRAAFVNAKGVQPGVQQVRLAGVDIGSITGVSIRGSTPMLTMAIEAKYGPLYQNARVELRPATPLDDMYVEIDSRGTPSAGRLGQAAVIPATQTSSPVDLDTVLATFNAPTRQMLSTLLAGLGQGLGAGGPVLRSAFVQLAPFLHDAQRLSDVLAARRTLVRELIHNFSSLTSAVAQRDRQLSGFVHYGNATVGAVAARSPQLTADLRELPIVVGDLQSALRTVQRTEIPLNPALQSLGPVAAELRPGLQALGRFSLAARPALRTLEQPVRRLLPFASALSPAATGLLRATRRLAPQAPELNSITADLLPCLGKLSDFFANTMSVMKFSDAGGVIPRSETTFGLDTLSSVVGGPNELGMTLQPTCTAVKN